MTVECLALNETQPQPRLRDHQGRESRKNVSPGKRDGRVWDSVSHAGRTWSSAIELSAAVITCTRPAQDWAHQHPIMGSGRAYWVPPLSEDLLAAYGCWGQELHFLHGVLPDELPLL